MHTCTALELIIYSCQGRTEVFPKRRDTKNPHSHLPSADVLKYYCRTVHSTLQLWTPSSIFGKTELLTLRCIYSLAAFDTTLRKAEEWINSLTFDRTLYYFRWFASDMSQYRRIWWFEDGIRFWMKIKRKYVEKKKGFSFQMFFCSTISQCFYMLNRINLSSC